MFNIYYINYEKAFEISMLINNRVQTQFSKEKDSSIEGRANSDIDTSGLSKVPYLGKIMPSVKLDGEINGAKSKKVIDTFNVVSTKSTVLEPIYRKADKKEKLLKEDTGKLVILEGVSLEITNPNDVIGTKALLRSDILNQIPIDGMGNLNLTSLLDVFLKESSYIVEGTKKCNENKLKIMLKIPMNAESEMESHYDISDIEIGEVSIVGIYKGCFNKNEIESKINKIKSIQNKSKEDKVSKVTDIEDGQLQQEYTYTDKIHYIDVIAIVQDLKL